MSNDITPTDLTPSSGASVGVGGIVIAIVGYVCNKFGLPYEATTALSAAIAAFSGIITNLLAEKFPKYFGGTS